jgi:GNAT superfamily N-acetyltransferase
MSSIDPTRLAIERLSVTDAPANVALSRSVGWKDEESEWRVLHDAADVRGVRPSGALVAQCALGDYGTCATLAKMVVAPEWQGRGLGARLLDDFLAEADARGTPVGLCATDQGRPLYESRRFEVTGELVILLGTPNVGTGEGGPVVPLVNVQRAVELERTVMGCDRSRMLRARFRETSSKYWLDDPGAGFGMASQQGEGTLVGPIVARSEQGARQLALALLATASGPVRIDVPIEHVAFRTWLLTFGLQERARRVEMARSTQRMPWQVPERFALATQAWG